MTLWIGDVEVAGGRCDVEVVDGRVAALHPAGTGTPSRAQQVIDGAGGALLPGLHDHHLHLLSLAAAMTSVDCGGAGDLDALRDLLGADRHPDGWVRGTGYDEGRLGRLDRHLLDELVPDRPVRVQHRSGALWVLNSRALACVEGHLDASADVERDPDGTPNGRLWRYDTRLAPALPQREPDLATLGTTLRRLGITGVTDATPDLDAAAQRLLSAAVTSGRLPVRVMTMALEPQELPGLSTGPAKLLLRDHDLPSLAGMIEALRRRRGSGRPVAVHCVSAESLVLTVAALDELGVVDGDRIEHAAVVLPGYEVELAQRGLRVVTQPGFLATRGERYRAEVDPGELDFLYPTARLARAGVRTVCSSDAPFGVLDPWRVIAAARDRITEGERVLGEQERISAAAALAGYLSPAHDPGGAPRRVRPGAVADLVLLAVPLQQALAAPDRSWVRGTLVADDRRASAGWMDA